MTYGKLAKIFENELKNWSSSADKDSPFQKWLKNYLGEVALKSGYEHLIFNVEDLEEAWNAAISSVKGES